MSAPPSVLAELQTWYRARCDGYWENLYGVSIQSTDNPGWWVKIDLAGTPLAGEPFAPVLRGDGASPDPQPPWLNCRVVNDVFHGAGDAASLEEILHVFLEWARP